MLADDNLAEFPARIAVEQVKTEFSVIVMVDISKLRFTKKDDRQMQRIAS